MAESKKSSKKAEKRARDQHFEARFACEPGEALWDATVRVEAPAFWSSIGCEAPSRRATSAAELLLAALAEEDRCAEVAKLRKHLGRACGDKYPSMCFERWHLAASDESEAGADPMLPTAVGGDAGGDVLRADLIASKHTEARKIALAQTRACGAARDRVEKAAKQRRAAIIKGGEERCSVVVTKADDGPPAKKQKAAGARGKGVTLILGEAEVELPSAVYAKLKELAARNGSVEDVDLAIFILARRYDSLGGAGFQAALPARAFAALREHFGVQFECFASPFNCYYERFCSAFGSTASPEDFAVDAPFGSLGSFWDFAPRRGAFEVNPPFAKAPLDRAARKCGELLERAGAEALTFAFVAPVWEDGVFWAELEASKFKRGSVRVGRDDHAWRDGRTAMARRVPVDTAIFILQTAAAALEHPCDDGTRLEALKDALYVPLSRPLAGKKKKKQKKGP